MTRRLTATAILIAFCSFLSIDATTSTPPLMQADLAWEQGDYPAALAGYLRLLDGPGADAVLEPIALRTGELFQTIEVTPDGALPQFSPDDRHFIYEKGVGVRRVTRLVATAEPTRVVTELQGWGAAFSPDGTKLAYVQGPPDTPEIAKAQAALENASMGTTAERNQRLAALGELVNPAARIVLRELATGREVTLETGTVSKASVFFGAGDTVIFAGSGERAAPQQIYYVSETRPVTPVTSDATDKIIGAVNSTGTALVFTTRAPGSGRGGRGAGGATAAGGGGRGGRGGPGSGTPGTVAAPPKFGVMSIPDGTVTMVNGTAPAFSADGRTIVFVSRSADENSVMAAATADPATASIVRKGPERVDAPAASADGSRVACQMMAHEDWEIVTVNRDGTSEMRLTRDAQHDLLPQFLSADRVLAVTGEARHRRSFLYDLPAATQTRLFHNNTVRTIAPEYSWEPSRDGTRILVVAERDGDTVSPRRGVYLMDLSRRVTRQELRARIAGNLAAEEALRAKSQRLYAPLAATVKALVAEASIPRVYAYQKALFAFDSKHISRPGNKLAAEYLFDTYKSFGYAPEFQWFDRENALGGRTANVIATLKGTVNPELIYVASSHYDSVAVGPGADDDSSGTAALLETARIMAGRPQPATIIFVSFTGEEAGLLGSREFVRRAVADKLSIVGALNNDMVGWANDHRLDNTIRYSNPGIRDVQHAAAIQFTNLITYDALYFKGTDAAAYYEAFGDIVGGIGSYPVLSSPHYHQAHDVLENMNHTLITEVAKTTVATLTLLASSPSRLTGLKVDSFTNGTAVLSWKPSPEKGVTGYVVAYGPPTKPDGRHVRVTKPTVTLTNIVPGATVSVKAVNAEGLESWDAARLVVRADEPRSSVISQRAPLQERQSIRCCDRTTALANESPL
jgi:Peptidase family M28/Fibronectin type III domain/WD40-like Beta Propeller Repeat